MKSSLFMILMVTGSVLWSSARITSFNARRDNNTVAIEWTAVSENISTYEIWRSSDQTNWMKIGDTPAVSGSCSYLLRDNSIFKALMNNFYYRLVIVDQAGQANPYDVIVSVSGSSGIRHTWGSVKAMFR